MNTNLRDEVIRLLSPHMIITRSGGGTFVFQPQNPRIQDSFPDLDVMKRNVSLMTLSEAKRAGIVMYGDASFSIDAYEVERFQGFAHFVAALIVHKTRGGHDLRDIELDQFEPEKGWKTLFGRFAKGVTGSNIFPGRKRLGNPRQACRMEAIKRLEGWFRIKRHALTPIVAGWLAACDGSDPCRDGVDFES